MILIFSQNAWFNCVICAEDRGAGGHPPASSVSRSVESKIGLIAKNGTCVLSVCVVY